MHRLTRGLNMTIRAGTRQGYMKAADVENVVTNERILENLTKKTGTTVKKNGFKQKTITNGGSQSQIYALSLSDGSEWIIKQVKISNSHNPINSQLITDQHIQNVLGDFSISSAFVTAAYSQVLSREHGILIFPNAEGKTLIDILANKKREFPATGVVPGMPKENQNVAVQNVGLALAQIQLHSLKAENQENMFYENNCDFSNLSILYHPDFQFSNIVVDDKGVVKFIDTDGTQAKTDQSYANVIDVLKSLEIAIPNYAKAYGEEEKCQWLKLFLTGYLSVFPEEQQRIVMNTMRNKINDSGKFQITDSMIPDIPVKLIELSHVEEKSEAIVAKKDRPSSPSKSIHAKRLRTLQSKNVQPISDPKSEHKNIKKYSEIKKEDSPEENGDPKTLLKDEGSLYIHKKNASQKKITHDNKVLFDLTDASMGRIFWKPTKQNKTPGEEEGGELSGSAIAHYVTDGLVPKAHLRELNGQLGIGQEFVTLKYLSPDDPALSKLTPEQVAQIITHLIADKATSNYDCHFDQFGIDSNNNIIGIDKGHAFKNFKRNNFGFNRTIHNISTDTDKFDLRLYGPDNINFYKTVMDMIKTGELHVDFDAPIITKALQKCAALTIDDVKRLYGAYANLRYRGNDKLKNDFFIEVLGRNHAMTAEFEKFRNQYDPQRKELSESIIENQETITLEPIITLSTDLEVENAQKEGEALRNEDNDKIEALYLNANHRHQEMKNLISRLEEEKQQIEAELLTRKERLSQELKYEQAIQVNLNALQKELSGSALSEVTSTIQEKIIKISELQKNLNDLANDPKHDKVSQIEKNINIYQEELDKRLKIKSHYEPSRIKNKREAIRARINTSTNRNKDNKNIKFIKSSEEYTSYLNLEQYYNLALFFAERHQDRPDSDFLADAISVKTMNHPKKIKKRVDDFIKLNENLDFSTIMDIANGVIVNTHNETFSPRMLNKNKINTLRKKDVTRQPDEFYLAQQALNEKLIALRNACKNLETHLTDSQNQKPVSLAAFRVSLESAHQAQADVNELLQKPKVLYTSPDSNDKLEFSSDEILDHIRKKDLEDNIITLEKSNVFIETLKINDYRTQINFLKKRISHIKNANNTSINELEKFLDKLNERNKSIDKKLLTNEETKRFEELEHKHAALQEKINNLKTDQENKLNSSENHEAHIREKVINITALDPNNRFQEKIISDLVNSVQERCHSLEEINTFFSNDDNLLQIYASPPQFVVSIAQSEEQVPERDLNAPSQELENDLQAPEFKKDKDYEFEEPQAFRPHQFIITHVVTSEPFLNLQKISLDVNKAYQETKNDKRHFLQSIMSWSIEEDVNKKQLIELQRALNFYTKNPADENNFIELKATVKNMQNDIERNSMNQLSQGTKKPDWLIFLNKIETDINEIQDIIRTNIEASESKERERMKKK